VACFCLVKQFNIQVLWREDNGQAHDHQLPVSLCHNSFIISGLLVSLWIQNQASLPTNSPFCSPKSGQPLLLQLVILRRLSGFS
jgi:hypothetical protein